VVCWRSGYQYADDKGGDNGQLEKFKNVRLPELTPVGMKWSFSQVPVFEVMP
jgi:hypothetical protein